MYRELSMFFSFNDFYRNAVGFALSMWWQLFFRLLPSDFYDISKNLDGGDAGRRATKKGIEH